MGSKNNARIKLRWLTIYPPAISCVPWIFNSFSFIENKESVDVWHTPSIKERRSENTQRIPKNRIFPNLEGEYNFQPLKIHQQLPKGEGGQEKRWTKVFFSLINGNISKNCYILIFFSDFRIFFVNIFNYIYIHVPPEYYL